MKKNRKRAIGAAAGAAAAATAVGFATAKMMGNKSHTYHVRPDGDQWLVQAEGAKQPAARHDIKRDAVSAGRTLAGKNTPSQLVIHRSDGSVQKEHRYE